MVCIDLPPCDSDKIKLIEIQLPIPPSASFAFHRHCKVEGHWFAVARARLWTSTNDSSFPASLDMLL